jgi:hypothetical protein
MHSSVVAWARVDPTIAISTSAWATSRRIDVECNRAMGLSATVHSP